MEAPMAPLVSIIINNYNYGQFLRRAIESALGQTYDRVELVIVDDGSSDDSRDIISEYADRATVVLKANGGQASALNAGIARARGQFALLLDSDDCLFPEAVATCVAEFPQGYARIYYRLRSVDEHDRTLPGIAAPYRFELIDGDPYSPAYGDPAAVFLGPPTSGNFFAMDALRTAMPIPEHEYRICADAYLMFKTAMAGPIRGLDRELAAYRLHAGNGFYALSSLFANPRRLDAQILNYFTTARLRADATRKRNGAAAPSMGAGHDFWLLHLLCAGWVWEVGDLPSHGIQRQDLARQVDDLRQYGPGSPVRRLARWIYLRLLLALPRSRSRELLRWVDHRKFRAARRSMVGTQHAQYSAV